MDSIKHVLSLEIIVSATILGAIVKTILYIIKRAEQHLQTEVGKIIKVHVKSRHSVRLINCQKDDCSRLRTEPSQLHPAAAPLEL